MTKRKSITAKGASSIGPYSHAIDADGFVYLSGQTPIDPQTGKLVDGDIFWSISEVLFMSIDFDHELFSDFISGVRS